jgi:hypothetical protein
MADTPDPRRFDGDSMEKWSKNDNYFLQEKLPVSELQVGQGEMSEQSRFLGAQFEQILD